MKKRIAWFCAHSSSDFLKSQQIFTSIYPKVSAEYEIDLFLDNYDLDEISSGKVTTASINTFHYLQAIQRHKTLSYSCFFYQIEDHPRAQYIFRHSQLMPGITYFHDLNLNQIYLDRFKDSTAGTDLNQEMDELFGKQSARLGNYKVRGWNNNIFDGIYQRGFEQLEKSAVTLVENTAQHEIIEKKIEDYNIEDCQILKPYFSLDSSIERNYNKAELKKELGLRSSDRILTYSLSSNYSNHLSTLLDLATTSEFQKLGITLLIITNQFDSTVLKRLQGLDLANHNLKLFQANDFTEYCNLHKIADFHYSVTSDALRGVPQGVVISSYFSVPIITSNVGWARYFNENLVAKVSFLESEIKHVFLLLSEFVNNQYLLEKLSENSRLLYESEFSNIENLDKIFNLIEQSHLVINDKMKKQEEVYIQEKSKLFSSLKLKDKKLANVISNCK